MFFFETSPDFEPQAKTNNFTLRKKVCEQFIILMHFNNDAFLVKFNPGR